MSSRLLSAAELISAPTGIDWDTVAETVSAPTTEQSIEQLNIIDSATAWICNYLSMPLGVHATTQTEAVRIGRATGLSQRGVIDQFGTLTIRTATLPVLSVTSMQYTLQTGGATQVSWTSLNTPDLWITGDNPQIRQISDSSLDWTCYKYAGPPLWVQYTYVSGWPNTFLTASGAAGSGVTLSVDSTLGMSSGSVTIGNLLTIYDGASTETVAVTAVPSATTVTVSNLAHDHSAGVRVSAVPMDIREAAIFACMFYARQRGGEALVMAGGGTAQTGSTIDAAILGEAEVLLQPYRVL